MDYNIRFYIVDDCIYNKNKEKGGDKEMKESIIFNGTDPGKPGAQNDNPVIILDEEEFGIGITGAPGEPEGPGKPPVPCCGWGSGAGAMEEDIIL